MARRKKRSKSTISGDGYTLAGISEERRMEALGLLFVIAALALGLALWSEGSSDRLMGPVGVVIARALLWAVGLTGYALGIFAVLAGGLVLMGRARWPRLVVCFAAATAMSALLILVHLVEGDGTWLGAPAGGAIGAWLFSVLHAFVGPAGAALVALTVLLLSLLGLSRVSFGEAVRAGHRWLTFGRDQLQARVETFREAQRVEAERAELLAEEAAERRRARELAWLEKEEAQRQALEEKKRLALLKAEAKAEERVLARRKAEETRARLEREHAEAEQAERRSSPPLEIPALESPARAENTPSPLSRPPFEVPSEVPAEVTIEAPRRKRRTRAEPAAPAVAADERSNRPTATPSVSSSLPDQALSESGETEIEPGDLGFLLAPPSEESNEVPDPDGKLGPAIIEHHPERPDLDAFEEEPAPREKKDYQLPPLRLLDYDAPEREPVDGERLRQRAIRLEEKLRTYAVEGRVVAIRPGPVVTTYEYLPAPGVKVAKIAGLSDDIAMSMEAHSVRIIAPIPGKGVVGIELPNDRREPVYLKEIIAHERFMRSKPMLTLALGKDTEGEVQVRDLGSMPHLLVAGTTGSGKSVSVNAMILSILYKATPDQVKFIMVDPKMLELSLYNDIPHNLLPVVTDPKKAALALQWAVDEMERRYKLLSEFKVRNIEGFNKKLDRLRKQRDDDAHRILSRLRKAVENEEAPPDEAVEPDLVDDLEALEDRIQDPWPKEDVPADLPYIVVLIDEFADLMCVAPREIENSVQRLAQKARAAGIHVLLATQRPSTDVITGVIKNNFPSRLSFRVASRHDSQTVINQPGAEQLLGMGDMLALGNTSPNPVRIHGAYVSEDEVLRVVEFWKAQARPVYDESILQPTHEDDEDDFDEAERDPMYDRAVQIVVDSQRASISAVQRRLRVGYNRAARMVEMMEKAGIVGPASGPKGEREVLVRPMAADGPRY